MSCEACTDNKFLRVYMYGVNTTRLLDGGVFPLVDRCTRNSGGDVLKTIRISIFL